MTSVLEGSFKFPPTCCVVAGGIIVQEPSPAVSSGRPCPTFGSVRGHGVILDRLRGRGDPGTMKMEPNGSGLTIHNGCCF